jgi:hypothetical protein
VRHRNHSHPRWPLSPTSILEVITTGFLNSYGTSYGSHVTLERFDPKTRQRETVMLMPGGARANLGMLSVSPDEQWVLFTRDYVVKSELVLIENFH